MGDFIAQIKVLGNILVLWAIKFVNKNAKKAHISGFGRYISLGLCSKYVCGRYDTPSGRYLSLIDLGTLQLMQIWETHPSLHAPLPFLPRLRPCKRRERRRRRRGGGGGGGRRRRRRPAGHGVGGEVPEEGEEPPPAGGLQQGGVHEGGEAIRGGG